LLLALLIAVGALQTEAAAVTSPSATTTPIVIRAGSLLDCRDGKAGPLQRNAVIVVDGDTIADAGPADRVRTPPGAQVIDLTSYTVMPGLIDAHTHVLLQGDVTEKDYEDQILRESIPLRTIRATVAARTALMNGFTTLRDLGTEGAGYADVALKQA